MGESFTWRMVLCISICHLIVNSHGSKILLLPVDHIPHVDYFALIGKSLLQSGHQVQILAMGRHKDMLDQYGIETLVPNERARSFYATPGRHENQVFKEKIDPVKMYQEIRDIATEQCGEILDNDTLMKSLEEFQYDLAIVDGFDINRCLYIIPYRLGIRYITLTLWPDVWTAMIPALPSVEGKLGKNHIGSNSTITDRLYCLVIYIYSHVVNPLLPEDSVISRYAPNQPETTFESLVKNSEMFLIQQDNLCLDGHRVSAPHYVFIGGIGYKAVQSLPERFESFINDADHGFIIMCLSSKMKILPIDFLEKLMAAFRQVKHKVIIRHGGPKPDNLPTNVLFADWLPQNDLLSHPKTRLFITHGGHNSQLEAVYHAVPMLYLPFYLDQSYNAERAIKRGYGLRLDWESFTSDELLFAIKELINNPEYAKKVQHCSDILRSFPAPQEKARFWIEHILKFGSSHLRPKYIDMPLWKFFMLDIVAILLIMTPLLLFLVLAICFCLKHICSTVIRKKKKTQ